MRAILAFVVGIFLAVPAAAQSLETLLASEATGTVDFGAGITATRVKIHEDRIVFEINNGIGRPFKTRIAPDAVLAEAVAKKVNVWKLPVSRRLAVDRLVAKGVLRRATIADNKAWQHAAERRSRVTPRPKVTLGHSLSGQTSGYVLEKPIGQKFVLDRAVPLMIPKRFKLTDAPQGARNYYRMGEGMCWGTRGKGAYCDKVRFDEAESTASPKCFPNLPERVEVHAFGALSANGSRAVSMLLGESTVWQVGQVDVYVPSTADPVFLTLGGSEPIVWAIHMAPGARIAGVLVRGGKSQAVSGLPEDIPLRFSTRTDGNAPDCGDASFGHFYTAGVESWARDVEKITGRGFDNYLGLMYPTHFLIGQWSGIPNPSGGGFLGGVPEEQPSFSPGALGKGAVKLATRTATALDTADRLTSKPKLTTPRLELDPIDKIRGSAPVRDKTFSLYNPLFIPAATIFLMWMRRRLFSAAKSGIGRLFS